MDDSLSAIFPVIGSHADALAAPAGCHRHRPAIREHDPEHEEVAIDDLGCELPPNTSFRLKVPTVTV